MHGIFKTHKQFSINVQTMFNIVHGMFNMHSCFIQKQMVLHFLSHCSDVFSIDDQDSGHMFTKARHTLNTGSGAGGCIGYLAGS